MRISEAARRSLGNYFPQGMHIRAKVVQITSQEAICDVEYVNDMGAVLFHEMRALRLKVGESVWLAKAAPKFTEPA